MRLRYAGQQPVTFTVLGLEVEPGDVFEVDDVEAQRLLARADVEEVPAPTARRSKAAKSAAPESAGAPAADVTEEV